MATNDLTTSTARRDTRDTRATIDILSISNQALRREQVVQVIRNSGVIARSLGEKIRHVSCASSDIAVPEIAEELLELDVLTSEAVDVSIVVEKQG